MAEPEILPIGDSENSWVYVYQTPYVLSPEQWQELIDLKPDYRGHVVIYGKTMLIPRYQRLFGSSSYSFSGVTVESEPMEGLIADLVQHVNDLEPDYKYNGALVNWYMNGEDNIGPHSDDERDLVDGAPIYSFSFGAERVFRFHPKKGGKKVLDIPLTDGLLIAMAGDCQKEFKHSIPKTKTCTEPRVNVTVRAFKK